MEDEADVFGMVFPVYAWGIPKVVKEYIETHQEDIKSAKYVWAVMTCGDDIGYADKVLNQVMNREVDAVFSVHMPNTYVCLPGFDVDKDEVAQAKVQETLQRIPFIAESIKNREKKTEVVRGACAWLKTSVLRPLFNRFLVTDKYFHTTKKCTTATAYQTASAGIRATSDYHQSTHHVCNQICFLHDSQSFMLTTKKIIVSLHATA